jgi:hypothetical protein
LGAQQLGGLAGAGVGDEPIAPHTVDITWEDWSPKPLEPGVPAKT